jgi:hypothetical protein
MLRQACSRGKSTRLGWCNATLGSPMATCDNTSMDFLTKVPIAIEVRRVGRQLALATGGRLQIRSRTTSSMSR